MPAHKVTIEYQVDLNSDEEARRLQSLAQLMLNSIAVLADPQPTIKIDPVRVVPVSGLITPPTRN